MSCVVAISGRLRSGKTSLALAVAEALGYRRASFGDYVRASADRQGLPHDRATLQELGAQLIAEQGWAAFCENALAEAGLAGVKTAVVVEGVRHLDAIRTLRELFAPARVVLVHVDPDDEQQRLARVRGETGGDESLDSVERHSTERDAKDLLPAEADLIIRAGDGVDAARDGVLTWLSSRQLL
jgi:dephospho-CoA kinase